MTSLPANELDKCALWVFYTTLLENKFKFFKFNYEINLDYPEMLVLNTVLSLGLLSQGNLIRTENESNMAGSGGFVSFFMYNNKKLDKDKFLTLCTQFKRVKTILKGTVHEMFFYHSMLSRK